MYVYTISEETWLDEDLYDKCGSEYGNYEMVEHKLRRVVGPFDTLAEAWGHLFELWRLLYGQEPETVTISSPPGTMVTYSLQEGRVDTIQVYVVKELEK